MRRNTRKFLTDERAIEGLPIRLVIALVVGVAALGIMMSVLGDVGDFGDEEVTVQFDDELVTAGSSVNVSVVTEDGEPVEEAEVLVTSGSLTLQDNPIVLDATNGSAELDLAENPVDFRSDQNRGELEFEVVVPSDSDYVDDADNPSLTVIDG